MKHSSSSRRLRSRGNGKRHPSGRGQNFESAGPDGKIRGTAQQVLDRYLALARDATLAGDPITAESYFQYAEHYYRVLNSFEDNGQQRRNPDWSRQPVVEIQPTAGAEAEMMNGEAIATEVDGEPVS
ncbi:MAG: DUF4167 domain-containing protein [Rhodospirillales bacterium]|nr:DUF4167 domain-containing protein [Rhodospirillales bacterium]